MTEKTFKLSIVMSDKSYVCNNINDQDIIIKEFDHDDQAHHDIEHNFKKIKEGWNYNHYIKKGAQAPTTKGKIWKQ